MLITSETCVSRGAKHQVEYLQWYFIGTTQLEIGRHQMRITWGLITARTHTDWYEANIGQEQFIGDLDLSLFPELGVELPFDISLLKECMRSLDC